MADELERRVGKFEERLDQHLDVLHSYIDKLNHRLDQNDRRMLQNEMMIEEIVRMNTNVLLLIDAMDLKVDKLEDRLGPAS